RKEEIDGLHKKRADIEKKMGDLDRRQESDIRSFRNERRDKAQADVEKLEAKRDAAKTELDKSPGDPAKKAALEKLEKQVGDKKSDIQSARDKEIEKLKDDGFQLHEKA